MWVLGDVAVDIALKVEQYPREGGDAFATESRTGVGGCGANIGIVLARLNTPATVIANVGADEWGRAAVALLRSNGVDVSAISYDPHAATHLIMVVVSGDAERTMFGHRGASANVGQWQMDSLSPTTAVIVSGYALLGDARQAQARRVVRAAFEAGAPVILDLPADPPSTVRAALPDVLPYLSVLVTGADEIRRITGSRDPALAARSLRNERLTVVVTLGSEGCLSATADGLIRVPGIPVDLVDTTGAGDAFVAGLTAAQLAGLGPRDTLAVANAFGAAATLRPGAGEAMPWPDQAVGLLTNEPPGPTRPSPQAMAWLTGVASK